MSSNALLSAAAPLSVMLAVAGAYVAASRRYSVVRHPAAIFLTILLVGVTVSVSGQVYRTGWTDVPAMTRRSLAGSAGWGLVITLVAWPVLRLVARHSRRPD